MELHLRSASCTSLGMPGLKWSAMAFSWLGIICRGMSGVIQFAGNRMFLKLSHFPWIVVLPFRSPIAFFSIGLFREERTFHPSLPLADLSFSSQYSHLAVLDSFLQRVAAAFARLIVCGLAPAFDASRAVVLIFARLPCNLFVPHPFRRVPGWDQGTYLMVVSLIPWCSRSIARSVDCGPHGRLGKLIC